MRRFEAHCVVLGHVDYGDSDRVVTLFAEGEGRLGAFAVAARKSTKRFGGALEPFTLINASLLEGRGELLRFERAEVREPFLGIRSDLGAIARASLACEWVKTLCREREAHPELFGALVDLLFRLSRGTGTPEDLLAFELSALDAGGFRPALDACVECGAPPGEGDVLSPERGGRLCRDCRRTALQCAPLPREVGDALLDLQAGRRAPLATSVRAEARALLERFATFHAGHPFRAAEVMRSLGVE